MSAPALELLTAEERDRVAVPGRKRQRPGRLTHAAPSVPTIVEAQSVKGKRRMITRYRPKVRIHDLRHSYASYLVSGGVSLHVVGKLLGHTQPQTTAQCRLQDEALREATNRFGEIFRKKTASEKKP